MKNNASEELMLLYKIAEKLVVMENKGYKDDGILKTLLQIADNYLEFSKDNDIVAIEVASYLPIRTNPDLDDNEQINVAFIEKQPTHTKKLN